MLHGWGVNARRILQVLGIDPTQIQRFRDASFAKDGERHVLRIMCRTGGGNRADFPNAVLTQHPRYLRDCDDDFDSTFAYYYFSIPDEVLVELASEGLTLDDVTDTDTLKEKTGRAVDTLKARDPFN